MGITKQAYAKSWFEKLKPAEISRRLFEFREFEKIDVYRLIVENAYEGIAVAQGDKFRFANKRMSEITGYNSKELLAKSFIEIVHPDDRPMVIDFYSKRLKGGDAPNTYPLRIVTKDEQIRWIQGTSIMIKWEEQPAVLAMVTDITSQKLAEQALWRAEERYRSIIEHAVVGVYETNRNGDVLYINDAMAKIFEYDSPDEIIGKNVTIFYANIKERDAFLKELDESGYIENFEGKFVTKTGKLLHAIATAVLVGGKITGMLIDISERKKSQEALETLINATHDTAMLIEPDGTLVAINARAAKIFKQPKDALIGQRAFPLMAPAVAEYRKKYVEKVLQSKKQLQHFEKHGSRYFTVNLFPILKSDGNVKQISIFAKNITELKKAEEALKTSEKKYRDIVDSAPIGIYETNLRGDILYVNDAMAKIFEFDSPSALIGTSAETGYKDKDVRKVLIEKLKATGKVKNFEFEGLTSSGKTKHTIINAVLREDKISGMIMDISALKEAEAELKRAHNKLENRVAKRTKDLRRKSRHLKEINIALKILLEKRNEDKTEMEEKILTNIKKLVLPYLEKAKKNATDEKLQTYLDILESNLSDILSPFSDKLSSKYMSLTDSEIKVADLVKHGKVTKEVAELLNVSVKTVETHRANIRKKLGITNKKANLRTCLLSIENG
jgi:PAS domain S-box-containing protein